MTPPRDPPVEALTTAWRPRDSHGAPRAHPAWHDLDDAGRREAYEKTRAAWAVEAALDPRGLSTTAHSVMRRIRGV